MPKKSRSTRATRSFARRQMKAHPTQFGKPRYPGSSKPKRKR